MRTYPWQILPFLFVAYISGISFAGVANPDISVIGQVIGSGTDNPAAEFPKKPLLELGEAEMVLDAALNPYLNGTFVLAMGSEGFGVEEAYASVVRGLPLNLGLKAGKYRLGFGRMNPVHPHVHPFISTPRVMNPSIAGLLPGDESFSGVALQASSLIPIAGSWALQISGDLVSGEGFHPDTRAADFGWLARAVNSFSIGDATPVEIGLSVTRGQNDPVQETRTSIGGADMKLKTALSPTVDATLQVEGILNWTEQRDSVGTRTREQRFGMYAFADVRIRNHWNIGALYEQYHSPDNADHLDRGIKPFLGFSVLEESTVLRIADEFFVPAEGPSYHTVELQLLFMMGPHKAHRF